MTLIAQIVAAFQPENAVRLDKMNPADEMAQKGRVIQDLFTGGVRTLSLFPEPLLSLGQSIWDVFHHRRVSVVMGPPVESLTLAAFGSRSNLQALLLAPHNWPDMVKQDPVMQLGAIVFCGSQSVDFYNGKVLSEPETILPRGRAYEAAMLRILQPAKLNAWQEGVLRDFPNGFDPKFAYERRPVEPMS